MPLENITTWPQLLRAASATFGDDDAVTLEGSTIPDDRISFAELDERSREIARGLLARGVGKGLRIGFICGNGPTFALLLAAIARIGAIAVPISTLIKSNELVRVLRQSDVHGLFVQRALLGHDYTERLCEAMPTLRSSTAGGLRLPEAPYLRWIVSWGSELPGGIEPIVSVTEAATSVDDALLEEVESEVHSGDQMLEIYTSGSMALPKGVKHLHGPVMFRAGYIARMSEMKRGKAVNAAMPMFWVGGLGMFLLPALISGAVTRCTEGTSTSSRHAMGSVLAPEDLAAMGSARPYWALGMSETFGPYSYGDVLRLPDYPLCAPLDHIAERYEVRIADELDHPVGDGMAGEVQVRGYALAPGLHKVDRDANYTADGFYRTGDRGLVDGSRIHFIGRSGDMIKTGGSNVSPAEVELEMQQLPGIQSAYVVGIPDPERGELVVAAVVPTDGAVMNFAAVEAELRKRLSSFKVPKAYVQIERGEVPMLPSNKVARRQIQAMMAARLSVTR